jgi:hypothetical protein
MRLNGASRIDVTENDAAEDGPTRIGVAGQECDPDRWVCVFVHRGYPKLRVQEQTIARGV